MNRLFPSLLLAAVLFSPCAGAANSIKPNNVSAEWVSEVKSIQPGSSFWVALQLTHDPHWHTYWKNPGDSGFPTAVNWELPDGFEVSAIHWPVPAWQTMAGLAVFGYEEVTSLLFEVFPPKDLAAGASVRLGGRVSWLECADICIPGSGELFVTLPVSAETPAKSANAEKLFKVARKHLPGDGSGWSATASKGDSRIDIQFIGPKNLAEDVGTVRYFPEPEYLFDYSDGLPVTREGNRFNLSAKLSPTNDGVPEKGIRGLLAAEKGWDGKGQRQGVETDAVFVGKAAGAPATVSSMALGRAILIALFGGVILNLMPCVFPVISLKILGFVNLAGENPRTVWRHGLLFAAGVMVSFWALAGLLLVVKASNPSLGWAFQFTNPIFVISMCILFLLMGLSLFGVFEVGTTLTSAGSGVQDSHSKTGTFLSGVLATVVATPCVGPFMGVAIGFAMSQPAVVAITIFTSLGFGMALPYLLLSRFPGWLKVIPRPGPWMESLKQFMGFLLLGFALFLVWVVADMRGMEGLGRLLSGLLVVGIAAWVYGRWGAISRATPTRVRSCILALALLVSGGAYAMFPPKPVEWLDYSPDLVEQLRSEGKPVFIDFTASWCVSCQANKKLVLNTRKIQAVFAQNEVAMVKADWTEQQEPITSVLASYGRNGVPLYVLYGSGENSEPQILPELLTKRIVIDALEGL